MAKPSNLNKNAYFDFGGIFERAGRYILKTVEGWESRDSTKEENMKGIDFFMTINGKEFSVDAKSPRREKRSDFHYMADSTWLEYNNTANGKGSLFGIQHYMAIFTLESMLLVGRKKLLDFCQTKVNTSKIKTKNQNLKEFELYSRAEITDNCSVDAIFKIKFDTIRSIEGCREYKYSDTVVNTINHHISHYNATVDEKDMFPVLPYEFKLIAKENE